MDADNKPASYAAVCAAAAEDSNRFLSPCQEKAMRPEASCLPVASPSEEITGQDFDVLLRIANDPQASQGRLKIKPRRIPSRELLAATAN